MTEVRDSREMSEEQERAAEKVAKMLALAAKNPNPEEAAAAAAKAQEWLARYNLDLATVEKRAAGGTNSGAGKREDAATAGGQYQYQRDLWAAISKLNFCLYFSTEQRQVRSKTRRLADGTTVNEPRYFMQRAHRLVGKVLNTTATRTMAAYLEGAIERICRERYPQQSQFFSRSAVSYRKGMAANLESRLRTKRNANLREDEERRRKDAEEFARRNPGLASHTALSLQVFTDEETDANQDFLNGEGWSAEQARKRAANKEYWAKYWVEQDRLQAEYDAANPEEAAKRAKKEAAAERRRSQRWSRGAGGGRGSRGGDAGVDNQAYYAGYEKANSIGLDTQAEHSSARTARIS